MHYGRQHGIWPEVMLMLCSHQWEPGAGMTRSAPRDLQESHMAAVEGWWAGGRGVVCRARGWFLSFLWHSLWKSQRKWISNDGSTLKIGNTFIPSCRSHASMEMILISWTPLPAAGMLSIEFCLKILFLLQPFTMQWVLSILWSRGGRKLKLAITHCSNVLFFFHFFSGLPFTFAYSLLCMRTWGEPRTHFPAATGDFSPHSSFCLHHKNILNAQHMFASYMEMRK